MAPQDPLPENSSVKDQLTSTSSPRTEPLWTVDEVARYLQKEPETVRNMARAGELKAFKVGREWRFKKSLIEEYLLQRMNSD